IEEPELPDSERILGAIRSAARKGARVASICSGAFILAATDLLDGKRATTHWLAAAMLKERYPEVVVDADVLFVDSGQLITSAGASTDLDMCLHLIRRDYGQAVTAQTTRLTMTTLQREDG